MSPGVVSGTFDMDLPQRPRRNPTARAPSSTRGFRKHHTVYRVPRPPLRHHTSALATTTPFNRTPSPLPQIDNFSTRAASPPRVRTQTDPHTLHWQVDMVHMGPATEAARPSCHVDDKDTTTTTNTLTINTNSQNTRTPDDGPPLPEESGKCDF